MPSSEETGPICPHCGSHGAHRLAVCSVCHRSACDKCASVQVSKGERRTVHSECLRHDTDGFSMIRIVK